MNTVRFPGYTIGDDAYSMIDKICTGYGKRVIAIGGKTAISKAKAKICSAVYNTALEITDFIWYGGEASYENVERLAAMASVQSADMIFAIGGGKAIDTCKVLAHRLEKPFFTFPTIASNCASFTSLGVVYYPSGQFRELSLSKVPPVHAFICPQLAMEAPAKYMWAGMGDTIAKYYEANISARGVALDYKNAIGVNISRMCAEPILTYGVEALTDNRQQKVSRAVEEVMLAIIVSTGMVSNFVEQQYNGHIAHGLFCSITMLPQIEAKHLHGEVVMYGVLLLLMCDKNMTDFERSYKFCKQVGLPTKLSDIDVTLDEIDAVLTKTEQSPELERSPYRVTKKMLYDAVLAMEEYKL